MASCQPPLLHLNSPLQRISALSNVHRTPHYILFFAHLSCFYSLAVTEGPASGLEAAIAEIDAALAARQDPTLSRILAQLLARIVEGGGACKDEGRRKKYVERLADILGVTAPPQSTFSDPFSDSGDSQDGGGVQFPTDISSALNRDDFVSDLLAKSFDTVVKRGQLAEDVLLPHLAALSPAQVGAALGCCTDASLPYLQNAITAFYSNPPKHHKFGTIRIELFYRDPPPPFVSCPVI
jgi:hypothetical protein